MHLVRNPWPLKCCFLFCYILQDLGSAIKSWMHARFESRLFSCFQEEGCSEDLQARFLHGPWFAEAGQVPFTNLASPCLKHPRTCLGLGTSSLLARKSLVQEEEHRWKLSKPNKSAVDSCQEKEEGLEELKDQFLGSCSWDSGVFKILEILGPV